MSDLRPVIVGVGNVLMGDDGVGPAAVEALRRAGADGRAELIDAGLAFSEVLCDIDPRRAMVVIDAVRGGGAAGSVYRIDPPELVGVVQGGASGPGPTIEAGSMASALSLHEVSVMPALRMEALSGREFGDVTLFGVEPENVAWGQGLSRPVARALERLLQAVSSYLDERAAPTTPSRPPAACGSENR